MFNNIISIEELRKTQSQWHDQSYEMTFTLGRGNEICVKAIESLSPMVLEKNIEDIVNNFGEFWSYLTTSDSQLRWIGPEKGAIHLATAAIVNAIWDIWAI